MTAFEELLEEQPFDKITVSALVKRAGVSPNTFYYHYQDIYMLLEDLLEDQKKIMIKQIKNYETDQVFLKVFEYFIKNQNIIFHIQNSIDTRIIEKYLNDIFEMICYQYVEKNMKDLTIDNNELKFVVDFTSYAFTGMIINWFTNDFMKSIHSISIEALFTKANIDISHIDNLTDDEIAELEKVIPSKFKSWEDFYKEAFKFNVKKFILDSPSNRR